MSSSDEKIESSHSIVKNGGASLKAQETRKMFNKGGLGTNAFCFMMVWQAFYRSSIQVMEGKP